MAGRIRLGSLVVIGFATATLIGIAPVPAAAQSNNHVISVADIWVGESDPTAFFAVTRTRSTGRPISVAYETVDGQAVGSADYETTRGTVTFAAQEGTVFVAIRLLDDALDEQDEKFQLLLTPVGGGVTAVPTSATGTIFDNDVTQLPMRQLAVTNLGTPGPESLTGYEIGVGQAITTQGHIAGTTHTPYYTNTYGFTWASGSVTATWDIGGTPRSSPSVEDMNENEQAVGSMSGEPSRAFLWENGSIRDLGVPFEDDFFSAGSVAKGINDLGQIVGAAGSNTVPRRAFLWENGIFTDLGTLGGSTSEAEDINESGQVVGASESASGASHAFLWQAGSMTDLDTLGGASSHAMAINDVGQVVGQSQTASGEWHVFLWQAGTMTDLGAVGTATVPHDINNAGQVVGGIYNSTEWRGFIWEAGTFWQLPDLDPPFEPGGDGHTVAHAINDSGHIAGTSMRQAALWS
jgi:probable HAF family extracellular repeat protein